MRAAIYARYSSDLQSASSIEDQVRQCQARIDQEGWTLSQVYSDAAISGATVLRPGYQKLLEDARNGAFDVVVAEALDRLSRDQADIAGLYKQLSFAGVQLVTLAEGEINELHIGLKGTMNALFLKDLARKTRRGLEGRVRQGRSGGGLCYGYDVVREVDAAGNPVAGGRRINEVEAGIVRRIFAMFAAGQSPRAIARTLNGEGAPGPRGRAWRDTTIRGHATRRTGILRNDLYDGRLVWNKQRYIKDPSTGKRLARPNPREEWIVHEMPALRIVDDDLWAAVQRRLDGIRNSEAVTKARKTRFWEQRRPRHLLTGLVHCGVCGGAYASIGRDYIGCGRARQQGNCGNKKSIRRGVLESLVLDGLRARLMAPELVKEFIAAFHAEVNRLNAGRDQRLALQRKELSEISTKLAGLINAIADGFRSDGLQQMLTDLEARKRDKEEELSAAPPPAPRLHPNLAELYRRKVADLHEALADVSIRQEAIELLRELIERITVTPSGDGIQVELIGDIVNMIELPDASGRSVPDLYRCSVKVVAGARYQLFRTPVSAFLSVV